MPWMMSQETAERIEALLRGSRPPTLWERIHWPFVLLWIAARERWEDWWFYLRVPRFPRWKDDDR